MELSKRLLTVYDQIERVGFQAEVKKTVGRMVTSARTGRSACAIATESIDWIDWAERNLRGQDRLWMIGIMGCIKNTCMDVVITA
jgi:hypothetical protein